MADSKSDRTAPVDVIGHRPELWQLCQSDAPATDRLTAAERLIAAGAHVNASVADGTTALHMAAWRGPLAMVELLLRHGAREWIADCHGKLPRDHAATGVAADRDLIVQTLTRPVLRDPNFRAAVAAIHAGDTAALKRLLADHPNLSRDRAEEPACYPPGYFGSPKLLWFVANNPTLVPVMAGNMVEIATAILDARDALPGPPDVDDRSYTLGLVMTSDSCVRQNLQRPLMNLLLSRGARAGREERLVTLGHQQAEPIQILLDHGLPLTAELAAGLGRIDDLARLLPSATPALLHDAFSMAVINRQVPAARLCLEAGADVARHLVVHTHSLPIHQAVANNDVPMAKLLVEHGTPLTVCDLLWNGTPLGWARHTQKPEIKAYLLSLGVTV